MISNTPSLEQASIFSQLTWIHFLIFGLILIGVSYLFNQYLYKNFEKYTFRSKRLWFLIIYVALSIFSLDSISSLRYFSSNSYRILTILSLAMGLTSFLLAMYFNCLITNIFYGILITLIQTLAIYFLVLLAVTVIMLFLILLCLMVGSAIAPRFAGRVYHTDMWGRRYYIGSDGNRYYEW